MVGIDKSGCLISSDSRLDEMMSSMSADQYFDGLISDCDKVYARWKAISDSARNMIVFAADGVSHQVSDNNVGGMLHLYVYDSVGYVKIGRAHV